MYKIINDTINSLQVAIYRLQDGASIPFDEANTDYQEYLKWLDAGNTPEAADE